MAPFQERVVEEKRELDEKREKLYAFTQTEICHNLPFDERNRLARQLAVMSEYSTILGARIEAFNKE